LARRSSGLLRPDPIVAMDEAIMRTQDTQRRNEKVDWAKPDKSKLPVFHPRSAISARPRFGPFVRIRSAITQIVAVALSRRPPSAGSFGLVRPPAVARVGPLPSRGGRGGRQFTEISLELRCGSTVLFAFRHQRINTNHP
jgi:hypothetical protein